MPSPFSYSIVKIYPFCEFTRNANFNVETEVVVGNEWMSILFDEQELV